MINGLGSTPNDTTVYPTAAAGDGISTPANTGAAKDAKSAGGEDELQVLETDELDTDFIIDGTEDAEKTDEEKAIDDINEQLDKTEKQYLEQIENCNKQIEQLEKQLKEADKQRRTLLEQMIAGSDSSAIMSGLSQINDQKASILNNITSILYGIENMQTALEENRIKAQDSIDQINDYVEKSKTFERVQTALSDTSSEITPDMELGEIVAAIGNSFVGVINSDKEGNAVFSNGVEQHWCADFVTSVVTTAFEATGTELPSGFGSSSVSTLRDWGKSNGRFVQVAGKSNKAEIIANNIKPGDILIQKENGASHTGIVTKVYPDGSYDTVEGNSSDAVKNRHYPANHDELTGFIKMT